MPNRTSIGALLKALSGVLSRTAEPVEFLRAMLEQAVERTGATRGVFVELPADGELEFRVLHRIRPRELEGASGLYSRSVCAHVRRTGNSICIDDARLHPEFMHRESIARLAFASILCVPIRSGERIAALVHLEHDRPNHFAPVHRDVLEWLAEVASPMLEALQSGNEIRVENECLRESATSLRVETQENRRQLTVDWSFRRFIGASAAVRQLEDYVRKAAATEAPILLLGETGTGKSMLARVLHGASARASGPFVTVACPNLPHETMEAELFGNRKGAFTDARADRIGKVQVADGGTLFLDEIGDLPLDLQPKLLRLVHDGTYETLGDPRERRANVRIIAATNCDLEQLVAEKRFRRDLFARLNYLPIEIPPLRARREDIPLLMRHCLDSIPGGRWIQIADAGLDYLRDLDCTWPDNVRNLEHLATRLVVDMKEGLASRRDIEVLMAPAFFGSPPPKPGEPQAVFEPNWKVYFAQHERAWLGCWLGVKREQNLTNAELAAILGLSQAKLYRKLREHGLND